MVNKQGQTRLAQYYEWLTLEERRALEGEIVRKCLARNDQQVPLFYLQIPLDRFWFCSDLVSFRSIDVCFDVLSFELSFDHCEFLDC